MTLHSDHSPTCNSHSINQIIERCSNQIKRQILFKAPTSHSGQTPCPHARSTLRLMCSHLLSSSTAPSPSSQRACRPCASLFGWSPNSFAFSISICQYTKDTEPVQPVHEPPSLQDSTSISSTTTKTTCLPPPQVTEHWDQGPYIHFNPSQAPSHSTSAHRFCHQSQNPKGLIKR